MSETNGNGEIKTTNGEAYVPTANGQFAKGCVPKSPGRPKGAIGWQRELELALRTVEKAKKKGLVQHAVERAYDSDKVLPHVLDRVVPKLADPNNVATSVVIQIVQFTGQPTLNQAIVAAEGESHG